MSVIHLKYMGLHNSLNYLKDFGVWKVWGVLEVNLHK